MLLDASASPTASPDTRGGGSPTLYVGSRENESEVESRSDEAVNAVDCSENTDGAYDDGEDGASAVANVTVAAVEADAGIISPRATNPLSEMSEPVRGASNEVPSKASEAEDREVCRRSARLVTVRKKKRAPEANSQGGATMARFR